MCGASPSTQPKVPKYKSLYGPVSLQKPVAQQGWKQAPVQARHHGPRTPFLRAPGLPALVLSEPEVSEPADFRVSSGALLMFCLFVKLFLPGAEGYSSRGFSEHGMIYFGNSETLNRHDTHNPRLDLARRSSNCEYVQDTLNVLSVSKHFDADATCTSSYAFRRRRAWLDGWFPRHNPFKRRAAERVGICYQAL